MDLYYIEDYTPIIECLDVIINTLDKFLAGEITEEQACEILIDYDNKSK